MAGKKSKNKKQIKNTESNAAPKNRAAQFLFILFALMIILSMVLSSTISY